MGSFAATLVLTVFDQRARKRFYWMPVAKSAAAVCGVLLMNSIFANLATDSLKLTNSDRAPARHLFWHSVVTSESLGNIGQSRGQTFDDASTHELVRNFLIEKGESITVQKVFGGGKAFLKETIHKLIGVLTRIQLELYFFETYKRSRES